MQGDILIEIIDNSRGGWVGLVCLKNSLGKNHQTREDQGFQGEGKTALPRSKEWENLDTSGVWKSRNINVLFELGRLEGHFIHLKNFARNINLHFIFVFQKTNHLIHALTTTVPICDWFMWLVYVPICHCSYMLTGFYMMETLVVKALSNTATLL